MSQKYSIIPILLGSHLYLTFSREPKRVVSYGICCLQSTPTTPELAACHIVWPAEMVAANGRFCYKGPAYTNHILATPITSTFTLISAIWRNAPSSLDIRRIHASPSCRQKTCLLLPNNPHNSDTVSISECRTYKRFTVWCQLFSHRDIRHLFGYIYHCVERVNFFMASLFRPLLTLPLLSMSF